jgi:hypothetical protein
VVDRRVLENPVQGRQLLTAVSYVGSYHRNRGRRLVAFYAVVLYAALRPAEVIGLHLSDCYLPEPPPYFVSLGKPGSRRRTAQYRSRLSWWRSCEPTSRSSAQRRTGASSGTSGATWSAHRPTGVCGNRPGRTRSYRTALTRRSSADRTTYGTHATRGGLSRMGHDCCVHQTLEGRRSEETDSLIAEGIARLRPERECL